MNITALHLAYTLLLLLSGGDVATAAGRVGAEAHALLVTHDGLVRVKGFTPLAATMCNESLALLGVGVYAGRPVSMLVWRGQGYILYPEYHVVQARLVCSDGRLIASLCTLHKCILAVVGGGVRAWAFNDPSMLAVGVYRGFIALNSRRGLILLGEANATLYPGLHPLDANGSTVIGVYEGRLALLRGDKLVVYNVTLRHEYRVGADLAWWPRDARLALLTQRGFIAAPSIDTLLVCNGDACTLYRLEGCAVTSMALIPRGALYTTHGLCTPRVSEEPVHLESNITMIKPVSVEVQMVEIRPLRVHPNVTLAKLEYSMVKGLASTLLALHLQTHSEATRLQTFEGVHPGVYITAAIAAAAAISAALVLRRRRG